jgi:type-F conjugative transfer system pilin assembly protein TrbC
MGLLAQKCHSSWRIIDGHSVFASCQSSHEPLLKLFLSPVGLNAMLSQLMFGYVVYVLWRILKQHRRVALLILILCPVVVNNVAASAIDPRFKKALDQQTHRSKLYQKDLQQLQTRSHQQIDQYADEARSATGVKQPNTGCTGKCPSFTPTPDVVPPLQVCMSFSVPLQVWKDLNEDLIRHNGVFVVKGLPNNSFQAFAEKVLEFRKLGITAPIQIDPKLFERLNVKHVPLFIVHDEDEPHIVSGTLTVPYVMDLMHIKIGEGR